MGGKENSKSVGDPVGIGSHEGGKHKQEYFQKKAMFGINHGC